MKKVVLFLLIAVFLLSLAAPLAFAQTAETAHGGDARMKYFIYTAFSCMFGLAIAAFGGALSQARSIDSALEGIARNPSASGKIQTAMIIGLAMIESLVIYALVVALILLFVDPFGLLVH